ncbi:hypothetical protein D3C80_1283680 [compost metagenome]
MSFTFGNRFWEQRSSHGRKPIFADPDEMWQAACEYFDWVEANPLIEMKAFAYQGVVVQEPMPKMRAMTLGGLILFLDIDRQTFANYKANPDFFAVVSKIEEVIRDQKFSGAAADLLNANIIARDLGLADKQEVSATVTDASLTDAQRAALDRVLDEDV